jgi:hypothetical protein
VARQWCIHLSRRLQALNIDEFDSIEKITHAWTSLIDVCPNDLFALESRLKEIQRVYGQQQLLSNDNDHGTYTNLLADLTILQNHSRTIFSDEL